VPVPAPAGAPVRSQRIQVCVLSGSDQGKALALAQPGTYRVGKAPDCALALSDPGVSRHHLEITVADQIVVRDLQSKNGTFFGGGRVTEIAVGVGAVLTLGGTELKFQVAGAHMRRVATAALDRFRGLIGSSLRMREVYALLDRVAASSRMVLIEGETGTGKEVCAEAIHASSARSQRPFVICDLAGVSGSLIESDLFGHVRGAFIGADRDRQGAFERADGGTIFIDEIGELALELQPRLLRALDQRAVKPVGSSHYRDVDVQVIAATNRDLSEEVKAGRFREDLYHRLSVIHVQMPALRQRKEDIPLFVSSFLEGTQIPVAEETWAVLASYDWPGNVRELRNVIERCQSLLGGAGTLEPSVLGLEPPPTAASWTGVALDDQLFHEAKERLVAAWERAYLTHALSRAGGNVAHAARRSGIDRPYLYRLMKKHGILP
jgi:DNA-binding NtrC family response regulator